MGRSPEERADRLLQLLKSKLARDGLRDHARMRRVLADVYRQIDDHGAGNVRRTLARTRAVERTLARSRPLRRMLLIGQLSIRDLVHDWRGLLRKMNNRRREMDLVGLMGQNMDRRVHEMRNMRWHAANAALHSLAQAIVRHVPRDRRARVARRINRNLRRTAEFRERVLRRKVPPGELVKTMLASKRRRSGR